MSRDAHRALVGVLRCERARDDVGRVRFNEERSRIPGILRAGNEVAVMRTAHQMQSVTHPCADIHSPAVLHQFRAGMQVDEHIPVVALVARPHVDRAGNRIGGRDVHATLAVERQILRPGQRRVQRQRRPVRRVPDLVRAKGGRPVPHRAGGRVREAARAEGEHGAVLRRQRHVRRRHLHALQGLAAGKRLGGARHVEHGHVVRAPFNGIQRRRRTNR